MKLIDKFVLGTIIFNGLMGIIFIIKEIDIILGFIDIIYCSIALPTIIDNETTKEKESTFK